MNVGLTFHSVVLVSFLKIVANAVDVNSDAGSILVALGSLSALSLMGSRLLFNMKEAGEKGLNQGTGCNTNSTASSIDFATPFEGTIAEAPEGEETEITEVHVVGSV